jgi:RimJ/RimL family protein N-acetyltransferase
LAIDSVIRHAAGQNHRSHAISLLKIVRLRCDDYRAPNAAIERSPVECPAVPLIPAFATPRLILRPPSPGDLDGFVTLGSDPDVMRYIGQGQTQSPTQAAFWLECLLADARHGFPTSGTPVGLPGWQVMIERETQAFVGLAALAMLPAHHIAAIGAVDCPTPCVEVGYRLAKPFWRRGYATEAASELSRYAIQSMRLPGLVAIADVRNEASNRVLEKVGLRLRTTYDLNGLTINFRSVTADEFACAHGTR